MTTALKELEKARAEVAKSREALSKLEENLAEQNKAFRAAFAQQQYAKALYIKAAKRVTEAEDAVNSGVNSLKHCESMVERLTEIANDSQ